MKVKMILPALTEAKSPFWRPIKYSLFPPLGMATLAAYLNDTDEISIIDEHVETLNTDDEPDLVVIQVYITSAIEPTKSLTSTEQREPVFVWEVCTLLPYPKKLPGMRTLFLSAQAKTSGQHS